MTNKVKQVEKVSDVIKVLNGGASFYDESLKSIENPILKEIFAKFMLEKKAAVEKLQPFAIAEQGEMEKKESLEVQVRSMYTRLLGTISFDKAHTYLDQLEEVEDKTLDVIDEALEHEQPEVCKNALIQIRRNMKACHDDMKSLQEMSA